MKALDLTVAWLMVVLGVIHSAFTLRYYPGPTLASVSFFSGGLAMILTGLLNAIRVQSGKRGGLIRFSSIFANVCMLAIGVTSTYFIIHRISANPQVPAMLVLSILATVFSLRGK
jgi:ABC-type transport system involved in cytochrome c biogenesis permease subunit